MNWLKVKLGLEVINNPALWLRNGKADLDFDNWLWDALDRNCEIKLRNPIGSGHVYTCEIDGVTIWIEDKPYADMTTYPQEHFATRITALRMRKITDKMLAQKNRFNPDSYRIKNEG